MEICIDAFHVCQGYSFAQDHLVESTNEKGVKEATVEDSQSHYAADKFEVIQVLWIDSGMRVDL